MIIEYEVECFDRCLVIRCPHSYAKHERKIKVILDKAYLNWHSPENITDPEEREWVENSACCEEYIMSKVRAVYPEIDDDSWDTFYYGNDDDEIEDDMEYHQREHKYNMQQLNNVIKYLEDRKHWFDAFEKLGNEAYHIIEDCVEKLKELKPTVVYKCKHCNFVCEGVDNDVEEELWGHIQIHHEDIFEEVQNWETPDMIEECYEEEV